MNIRKLGTMAVAVVLATASLCDRATGYEIVHAGQFANGTPCDQPGQSAQPHCAVYEVSGLMQDDTFAMQWDYAGPNDVVDVDGAITVVSISEDTMTIRIELTNNSVAGKGGPAVITSFGLMTGGELLDSGATEFADGGEGAVFHDLAVDDSKESKLAGIVMDLCIFGVGCSGGNVNAGLPGGGQSDVLTIDLVASDGFFDPGATLGMFMIKYQGADSFELPDAPAGLLTVADVAEPSSLAIAFVGLVGLALAQRKRGAPNLG